MKRRIITTTTLTLDLLLGACSAENNMERSSTTTVSAPEESKKEYEDWSPEKTCLILSDLGQRLGAIGTSTVTLMQDTLKDSFPWPKMLDAADRLNDSQFVDDEGMQPFNDRAHSVDVAANAIRFVAWDKLHYGEYDIFNLQNPLNDQTQERIIAGLDEARQAVEIAFELNCEKDQLLIDL